MEPVELILSALAAGAAAAASEVAGAAVKSTYQKLVDLISKKLEGKDKAKSTLDEYLKDPETYEKPMKKAIGENRIEGNEEVLALARELISLIKSNKDLSKYNVNFEFNGDVKNAQFIQGDNATVAMNVSDSSPVKKKITTKKAKK
jgi:hypothetical protein